MYEEELKKLFEKALCGEYTSILVYVKMAAEISGFNASLVAKELNEHAEKELEHARELNEYANNHGFQIDACADLGTVNQDYSDLDKTVSKTQELEQDAIDDYHNIFLLAQEHNDPETMQFAKHIMEEEMEHFDDLAKFTGQARELLAASPKRETAAIPL